MKSWKKIHTALEQVSSKEELAEYVRPLREEIKTTLKELKTKNINIAFRQIRARMLEQTRINLAVLEAAAYEEELETK